MCILGEGKIPRLKECPLFSFYVCFILCIWNLVFRKNNSNPPTKHFREEKSNREILNNSISYDSVRIFFSPINHACRRRRRRKCVKRGHYRWICEFTDFMDATTFDKAKAPSQFRSKGAHPRSNFRGCSYHLRI